MGSQAGSTSKNVKRLLPIAAAPAAIAGLAAAFAFGNGPASSATADEIVHHPAPTSATPQADGSAAHLVSVTQAPATGAPVVKLNAARVAAIQPKGKHHRTLPAKYVVKTGDTLASIAQHLYSSGDYWTVLYWANHTQIKYASEISTGQVLNVPAKPAKAPGAPKSLAPSPAPVASTPSVGSHSTATTTTPVQTDSTYSGSSGSFQACVIAAESGGNSQVMNSSGHYGLYQFSASTWAAYGGNPADFGDATVAEQNQVFDNAIAAGGESNWAPYDGC
ncbi:MAG TPA: transglycosylase family protein [Trebonia sp.]